jgi:hypothetical protein
MSNVKQHVEQHAANTLLTAMQPSLLNVFYHYSLYGIWCALCQRSPLHTICCAWVLMRSLLFFFHDETVVRTYTLFLGFRSVFNILTLK